MSLHEIYIQRRKLLPARQDGSKTMARSIHRIVKGGIGLITIMLAHVSACPQIFLVEFLGVKL